MLRYKSIMVLAVFGLIPAAPVSAQDGKELAGQVKQIFRVKCHECHGGSKKNGKLDVFDLELMLGKKGRDPVINPGKPKESTLYGRITDKEDPMPPNGKPGLSAEEIDVVSKWIAAGAPTLPQDVALTLEVKGSPDGKKDKGFPPDVIGVEYIHKKILYDVRKLPPQIRPYVRYFSLNHILTSGATPEELQDQRDALVLAVNHLSWQAEPVKLRSIDPPLDTVFAIDIREAGWDVQPWQYQQGNKWYKSKLNLYDMVLLEYPYGITYQACYTCDRLFEEYLLPSYMVRPVPFVRGDWFVSTITQAPLYEDMMLLPLHIKQLEHKLEVDADYNVKNYPPVAKRGGMTVSGVSRNNRIVERHPLPKYKGGYYWKSFDFKTSKGRENMFLDPLYFQEAGGEMIFSLPNGLQGYYVANGQGNRVDAAPTEIVVDSFASDKIVRNGLACMRCHNSPGMKVVGDDVRSAVLKMPGSGGFDKQRVLDLYPGKEVMEKYIDQDKKRFVGSLEGVLGRKHKWNKPGEYPLVPVSHRFLDEPLYLNHVAGELGLNSPNGLQPVFKTPQLVGLGMLPLSDDKYPGVVRRDSWEDYYDQVVRSLGLGIPVVPIDSFLRRDYPAGFPDDRIVLSTSKKNNLVEPGGEITLFVENKSGQKVYFELLGTSAKGEMVIVVPYTTLAPKEKYRFPKTGGIKIQPGKGKELVTLYASYTPFPEGRLHRAGQGYYVADRVVHEFYKVVQYNGRYEVRYDAGPMIKKTIEIETR